MKKAKTKQSELQKVQAYLNSQHVPCSCSKKGVLEFTCNNLEGVGTPVKVTGIDGALGIVAISDIKTKAQQRFDVLSLINLFNFYNCALYSNIPIAMEPETNTIVAKGYVLTGDDNWNGDITYASESIAQALTEFTDYLQPLADGTEDYNSAAQGIVDELTDQEDNGE
jgi:hypothetical protein